MHAIIRFSVNQGPAQTLPIEFIGGKISFAQVAQVLAANLNVTLPMEPDDPSVPPGSFWLLHLQENHGVTWQTVTSANVEM